ncbi:MAG: phosphoribosyltransferase [Nitrococcus mobilis]|nr:phosphoribosyltransferase [Nitrococcus mobilis]
MFKDRMDAAEQLAHRLRHLKGERPLVLAIPRGAVPMAKHIADALGGELDVVLVHKLGAPGNPEYAVGAVSEDGTVELSAHGRKLCSEDYIEREVDTQLRTLRARRQSYTPVRPPIDPTGRVVIVVDDGSATGATMIAALQTLRQHAPRQLIAALGVAPPDALRRIEAAADAVICLAAPSMFYAVGQHFADFRQISDEEVIELLRHTTEQGTTDN